MNGVPVAQALPVDVRDAPADRVAALFDAHYERLYRLARRLVPSADAARDLVQDTFLKLARSPGCVPSGCADREAWLVGVLINIRRDEWRTAAVRRRLDAEAGPAPLATDDPEGALVARATVWRALDTLAPRRRAVIVMHELDGMPVAAVASLLGIS